SARGGLKHQRRSAAMQHYVGLDVSVKETSVCIVDKAGKVIREVKVATKPAEILAVLTEEALAIERIGLEAGPLSQWLYGALAEAGLPVICVETRHNARGVVPGFLPRRHYRMPRQSPGEPVDSRGAR